MHSINTTDRPVLREVWINFWYRDAAEVTQPVEEMAQPGDIDFAIFQVHIGPSDYAHPEPEYVLQPSEEVATTFPAVSSNERRVYFY